MNIRERSKLESATRQLEYNVIRLQHIAENYRMSDNCKTDIEIAAANNKSIVAMLREF